MELTITKRIVVINSCVCKTNVYQSSASRNKEIVEKLDNKFPTVHRALVSNKTRNLLSMHELVRFQPFNRLISNDRIKSFGSKRPFQE